MLHELKIWPEMYDVLRSGVKRFELRRDDRNFQGGDTLKLREWSPDSEEYTGRSLKASVYYVLRDAEQFGLMPGFCAMSITLDSEQIE